MEHREFKIISGGQSGADRAALDVAIRLSIDHGGWCPHGRPAEDGEIPDQYRLMETPAADPSQRTEWNVRDSAATVVFSPAMSPGTQLAIHHAHQLVRPILVVDDHCSPESATTRLVEFLTVNQVASINVAGPRESERPGIGKRVEAILRAALGRLGIGEDPLHIIMRGAAEWNEWRRRKSEARVDMIGADLAGRDLSGFNLSSVNLVFGNLARCNLKGTDLRGADLMRADCTGADFRQATLIHTILIHAVCRNADFRGANFGREGHLSGCELDGANFEGCDLSECFLVGANLRGARLVRSKFYRSSLEEADFEGADITEIDLGRADLQRAKLGGVSFDGCKLPGANFSNTSLEGAMFCEADLRGANFTEARMSGAYLGGAWLEGAEFQETVLKGAFLDGANLTSARMNNCDLSDALLERANLSHAILRGSDLTSADLQRAVLVGTDLTGATLTGARVYGISAWDIVIDEESDRRRDLVITPKEQARVVVDEIDVAQFTYLLLHNPNIRRVINTIGNRGVLILGRFTRERLVVLEAVRSELRELGFVPILFDFGPPSGRNLTETILTLAGLSRFIVADITNPRSSPLELQAVVPNLEIPVAPIIATGERPFAMFQSMYNRYKTSDGGHILTVREYASVDDLRSNFKKNIVDRAVALSEKLAIDKAGEVPVLPMSADDD